MGNETFCPDILATGRDKTFANWRERVICRWERTEPLQNGEAKQEALVTKLEDVDGNEYDVPHQGWVNRRNF
jgi:hypothetical protein